ncbi:hypothetical protein [Acidovorax radicis]|uniref:hypothetical protein n=1 Tax=Acidovorax radicis TaxID=758826 RepID=UPI001CF97005|nr:hypothetical protein [Acidovorax radicis]UCV01012.1 hypothetical protein KI609_09895 [Acidovorax radicis]
MTILFDDDQFSSATLGVYSTNSFFTRFKSAADLSPADGDPYPSAVPTHVHEFIHYLHNISTVAGVRAAVLVNTAVFMATQYLMTESELIEKSSQETLQSKDVEFFLKHLNLIFGSFEKIEDCRDESIEDHWEISNLQSYDQNCFAHLFAYQLNIKGVIKKRAVHGVLKIGLNFITEGIAYEVEREVWQKNGIASGIIDDATPIFPYLTYEPVVNYIVGRKTNQSERMKVGSAALMHYSPSQGFIEACLALRKGGDSFDKYFKNSIKALKFYMDNAFEEEVDILREFYAHTDKLGEPFESYLMRIKSASQMRSTFPLVEEIFLQDSLTPSRFLEISSALAERLIIQEKADGTAITDYHGNQNGLASLPDEKITWFIVLCSAIHFVKQHFTADGGISKTKDLKNAICPFSGACYVEFSEGNPDVCKKTPWRFKATKNVNKNGVCWYVAGIRSITPESKKIASMP